jgi:glycosyltransferase involved in cell wall biosynthesis
MSIESCRISAIIPLYNGASFIEDAVRGVQDQILKPTEVIVVDDGSTDDGAAIVERLSRAYPIKLLHKENGGQSSARNHGVAHSEGDLIAFLDQDDIWYRNHLEELIKPFLDPRHDRLGWVYSDVDEIDEQGQMVIRQAISHTAVKHPKRHLTDCLSQDMFVLPSATLVSRKAFDAVGGFDERLSGYEDDDLFLRMFRYGFENVYLETALSKWRIFRSSASYSPRMAKSRRIYAQKLLDLYPDDPLAIRYYTRDLLVPRFHSQMVDEYKLALLSTHDTTAIRKARENLDFIRGYLPKVQTHKMHWSSLIISVVVPLHNGASFIEGALRGAMEQTFKPAEIIVVDDGSTDGGAAIVERLSRAYPIKLLHTQDKGRSSAYNHGIAHAGGDLIALLDQDDIWYPNHLEQLLKPFLDLGQERLGWVYSNVDEIDENGLMIRRQFLSHVPIHHPKRDLFDCLASDMFVPPSATLISRKAFEEVGGFDEHLSGYEDDDLFLRTFRLGFKNIYLNDALSKWRAYPSRVPYSPRTAKNLSLYARKLLSLYPDDPALERYYARDILVPRFLGQMLSEYKRAMTDGQPGPIRASAADLRLLRTFAGPKHRARLSAILGLGPVGKPAFVLQPFLRPLYRRLLS